MKETGKWLNVSQVYDLKRWQPPESNPVSTRKGIVKLFLFWFQVKMPKTKKSSRIEDRNLHVGRGRSNPKQVLKDKEASKLIGCHWTQSCVSSCQTSLHVKISLTDLSVVVNGNF